MYWIVGLKGQIKVAAAAFKTTPNTAQFQFHSIPVGVQSHCPRPAVQSFNLAWPKLAMLILGLEWQYVDDAARSVHPEQPCIQV